MRHQLGLRRGLDPFGRRLDPQSFRQREDRIDDRQALALSVGRAADEQLVDLDLVETGARQIAETRIALAEIVEHQPHAERLKARRRCQSRRIDAHEHAFGHFQLES